MKHFIKIQEVYTWFDSLVATAIKLDKDRIIINDVDQPYLFDILFYDMKNEWGSRVDK